MSGPVQEVSVLPEYVERDIELYIREEISKSRVLSRIPAEEILQVLVPKSEGMFKWVACQMPFLTRQPTPNAVRAALKSLPGTLNSTYEMMLERVSTADSPLVKEVLMWLSFCQRPLLLDELCEAVLLQEDQHTIDEDDRMDDPSDLLGVCQGLAEINPSTGSVSLAHGSIKTFLISDYIRTSQVSSFALDETECALALLRKSIVYLLMDPFKTGYRLDAEHNQRQQQQYITAMLSQYKLLDYVTYLWGAHAHSLPLREREIALIRQFFETQRWKGGGNFAFWISCLLPYSSSIGKAHETEPLYYAASFGIASIVRVLIDSGLVSTSPLPSSTTDWYIDRKGGRNGSTALQVACYRGHADVVELLLGAGADVNSTDRHGLTCLSWAWRRGHVEIAQRLLEAGAVPQESERTRRRIATHEAPPRRER